MNNKTLSMSFTGDIAFDKYMDGKWEDENLLSEEIMEFLKDSDHVIVDVEGPVTDHEDNKDAKGVAQMVHAINPKAVKVLDRIQADIWDICNNHMMDLGDSGLSDTIENAKKAGVKTIGAGKDLEAASCPVFFDGAGGVGMFAVGYRGVRHGCKPAGPDKAGCLTWNETEIIRNNIKRIKQKCRWCIIVCHGGEEFSSLSSPYIRNRYLSFLDMGADIIVCHHPHVPMNYELFPGKAIFYSLGNFIFDTDYQRSQFHTDEGILLKLHLNEDDFIFDAMGIKIDRGDQRVVKGSLPDIFCDIEAEEYEKLAPLAAKMLLSATKRQVTYLYPKKFKDATEDQWTAYFLKTDRIETIPGEVMDYISIYNLAQKEATGEWKESHLEKVKDYIIRQM
ncbi:MAG: CapA family protein [Lachnospiraceae bacterium]|nr:CapA family protein [Lachnospiraceae bacterium]